MTRLRRDTWSSLRLLAKAPGYTLATIITLALAIGANAAIFSLVNGVLLKPVPIHDPSRLVVCWGTDQAHHLPVVELTYRTVEMFSRQSRGFSQIAAMGSTTWPAWLKDRGATQRISSAGVTAGFFETLGAAPVLGRTLRQEDDTANAPPVALLSYGTWVSRFGADPGIIGTRISLNDQHHTIIGVMARGFDVPRGAEVWTPVVPILAASGPEALDGVGVLYMLGRLRPGVTLPAARAELEQLIENLLISAGASRPRPYLAVTSYDDYAIGPARRALWALLGAVGVLLLISCANVSGLMLTRVSLQRREHSIRLALGATAADLARTWAIETALLCAAGGVLGLMSASWLIRALIALAPGDIPRLAEVTIDPPVAAFTAVVVAVTACLCGIGPLRQAVSTQCVLGVNDTARSTSTRQTRRLRSALVIAQIALSVVLLVAAALVAKSFLNLRGLDMGYTPQRVLAMNVTPDNPRPSTNAWVAQLLTRLERLPGVEAAGSVFLRPLALGAIGQETWVILEGQPDTAEASQLNPALNYEVATPGYFGAMKIGLTRGRLFDARDDPHAPRVAIVSESAARRLWPQQDPIGKRLLISSIDSPGARHEWRTIVGVVNDVRYRGLDDVRLDLYEAASQAATDATTIVIRTTGDPLRAASVLQAEVRRLDPHATIDGTTTMEAAVGRVMAPWRFSAWTFGVFAVFAFGLACIGLFGVVSLDVGSRGHELAVRLAVGARRVDLLRCVLVPAAWKLFIGAALGAFAALVSAGAIGSLLFGVTSTDPATYTGVIVLVSVVVTVASYVPARHAARIDPAKLLIRH